MNLQSVLEQVRHELGLKTDFTVYLLTITLLLSRILPTILFTPMMGGETTPTEVKLGLALTIALVMFPEVSTRMQFVPTTAVLFTVVLLKEIFVGLCFSFIVGAVFQAASMGGQLIDNMSGTNQAQMMVPALGQSVSLYAQFKTQLVITLFLSLNGQHLVIAGIGESLAGIPLDTFPRFSHGMWPFFDLVIRVFADMLRVSIAISAPVILATFLTDMALGLVNKVAPQVQVFFIAGQIKPAATVLILFTSLHLILDRVVGEYGVMFRWLQQAIRLLS